MSSNSTEELFERTRVGDSQALGDRLERYGDMLRGTTQQELRSRLQVRVDASDVAPATFLDAYRDLENFRGTYIARFPAWLKQIRNHNILQSVEMQ